MFVNSIPLRNRVDPNAKFVDFLENIKSSCSNAFAHQDYPFDELVSSLKKPKDASRAPIFDTMFIYQNNGFKDFDFGGINAKYVSPISHSSKFDISLEVLPLDDNLTLSFEYCTKLFDEIFTSNFAKHYENILKIVLDNPDIPISNIKFNGNDEKVLYKFNKINLDDDKNQIFEKNIDNPHFVFNENTDIKMKSNFDLVEENDDYNKSTTNAFSSFTNSTNYDKIILENPNYIAPRNNIETQVASAFKGLLSVPNVGIDDNFFELGGDSLVAINLQIELLKSNLKLTYADIFENPTVRTLSKKISDSKTSYDNYIVKDEFSNFSNILQSDTILPDNINTYELGNIILTGSTGFLGAHVLADFLENESGKCYCLIRPNLKLNIEQKFKKSLHFYFGDKYDKYIGNRIVLVISDISNDNIGIEEPDLENIFKDIDCVINCAAKVSHFGNYSDFEKTNVVGTENLLKICLKFSKRFYQVSTISVSGISTPVQPFEKDVIFNENSFYIGQNIDNVYVKSKFEAEKLILKYISNGLDGYILRVGNLMNRYIDR